ncbi:MAG TPA: gamma carbonic anhydrase family protein [Gammaproteobacteria bacterium]|nr:gamma carbonic anhydrase family protein [Gammaproteobacteria bacterium]
MALRAFEGKTPVIASTAYIDPAAVVIGDVAIGDHSSLWPTAVARGDVNRIVIGTYTSIQDGAVLHATHDGPYTPGGFVLTVGNHVTVGHRAILHACVVGDYCLIGMAATIMDGAVLEPRVMLGAGALVPAGRHLQGGHLWVGAPARKIRALTDREQEMLEYSADYYVKLKTRHLGLSTA